MRIGARIIEPAGYREADVVSGPGITAAEITLIDVDPLAIGIDAGANGQTIDGYSLVISRRTGRDDDRIDHRISTRHVERPGPVRVGRRLQRGTHGELVAARLHLK